MGPHPAGAEGQLGPRVPAKQVVNHGSCKNCRFGKPFRDKDLQKIIAEIKEYLRFTVHHFRVECLENGKAIMSSHKMNCIELEGAPTHEFLRLLCPCFCHTGLTQVHFRPW